ncbi:hypothetical protein [Mycobacterium sp. TY813]|nr:hypothetical protein [Mycobacterium sp. TY813]MDP7729661.1 hypothetical protein [Mycobacterium sp. TY813]
MAHPKPGNDTPGTVTPGSRNSTTPRDLPDDGDRERGLIDDLRP